MDPLNGNRVAIVESHQEIVMSEIIMIGDARDFHAMDWYRTIKNVCSDRETLFATDLIDSEGRPKLVEEEDSVINLHNIDLLLLRRQSNMANVWRNIVKLLVSWLQIARIKSIEKRYPNAIFHAHAMYYMFLSWLARITFIGTPQGSEVLVRPDRSSIYKYFACKSLKAAKYVIVDSVNMQKKIRQLCGKDTAIVQFGIDVSSILSKSYRGFKRSGVISIRGMHPLYRIDQILEGRARSKVKPPLVFSYPFFEEEYRRKIISCLGPNDLDLGRLSTKDQMYEVLFSKLLGVSIPRSDSSPRSVYEAIFCGCCVAVTYSPWIDSLPLCMRSRLVIVDLNDEEWLDKAIECAYSIREVPYKPSEMALNLFDQERTMKAVADLFYGG